MNHGDHVDLIRDGVLGAGGAWGDFGSGSGAFTLALAELVGSDGVIYSIDRDDGSLQRQRRAMQQRFRDVTVHYVVADYTLPLDLPPLDGILMANALHFQSDREKATTIRLIQRYLRPDGRLILIEYNTDRGNRWVPYPLSYSTWLRLASASGYRNTRLLATRPSRFLGEIYSALSYKAGATDGDQSPKTTW